MTANNPLYGADIISIDQFSKSHIELVLTTAHRLKTRGVTNKEFTFFRNKIMTALFYEPSSRTFGSFIAAMQRLGGGVIPIQGVTYSSVAKGETLIDTVRTFESYSDVLVIRHPEVGSAKIAAECLVKPVINAGDGVGEHPTQAMLDLFTIKERLGKTSGLIVTMIGDLVNGRTVHSLSKLLSLYPKITLHLVSPAILKMPPSIKDLLLQRGVRVFETETFEKIIEETDVLYVTRIQKERFSDLDQYESLKNHYVITGDIVKHMKRNAIIMHPFPRVGEITLDVDLDPRAAYIRDQMPNGMYVRMSLLRLILMP